MEITNNTLPGTSTKLPEQQNKQTEEQNLSVDKRQQKDSVDISSAAQSLFSANDIDKNANIKTREQAEKAVQEINRSIQSDPELAAKAQANGAAELVSSFLG